MLACEWLQKRRVFGIKADIAEMAKFKSKIRKNEDLVDNKKSAAAESQKTEL